jgi:hypothetical protein
METATYYVVRSPNDEGWTIHHDGTDLGQYVSYDMAIGIATQMARTACEMGFSSAVLAVPDKGAFDTVFRCEALGLELPVI